MLTSDFLRAFLAAFAAFWVVLLATPEGKAHSVKPPAGPLYISQLAGQFIRN